MIENKTQYQITCKWIKQWEDNLKEVQNSKMCETSKRLCSDSIKAVLEDLNYERRQYERLCISEQNKRSITSKSQSEKLASIRIKTG